MDPIVFGLRSEFDFLCTQYGFEQVEAYLDEENFGNALLSYLDGEIFVDVIRDRDQVLVTIRHKDDQTDGWDLVPLYQRVTGKTIPNLDRYYGKDGSKQMAQLLRENMPKLRAAVIKGT